VPEGHTLHRLAREQNAVFTGRPVRVTSPQGRFEAGAALLDGRVLDDVSAYGKHLFARFGADVLHVHLGLYGTFAGGTGAPPPPRGALRMRWVADGADGSGVWTDLRGPTACDVLSVPEVDTILARLGPDPLQPRADGGRALRRIAGSRTAVGALLMDQSVLAGVGNVYRAELLSGTRRRRRVGGAHVGRPGHADALGRPDGPHRHHATRAPVPPERAGAAGGRPLRVPAHRAALPDLRYRGPHPGDGRAQPVLVPGLPGGVTGARGPAG
jgi:hypothetical protein